jgi:GMP synthase (glutamine-hydrolysing)
MVVDNGSVYTNHLLNFLESKIQFDIMHDTEINFSNLINYDSFILSGRRKNNQLMNSLNSKIIKHAIQEGKSLLGICYGAEILTLTLGGTIKKLSSPQDGHQKVTISGKNTLCEGQIEVFESHQYEISRLGEFLDSIAYSDSCPNEIIKVKNSNIFGTQFHPEMTYDGKVLIENFFLKN